MFELLKDLWGFMRERKKLWMAPIIGIMLLLGVLVVMTQGSALAPFIYTIFLNMIREATAADWPNIWAHIQRNN